MADSSRVRPPGPRPGGPGSALLPLAFAAIAAGFLWDVAFTGRAYLLRDVLTFFHPWQTAVRAAVRSGALPLWNHDVFCGLPLLANLQSGVFYPVNWLYWFLPFDAALTAGMVLHLAVAGILARSFLRRTGLADPEAFLGGALFAFGTWPLAHLEAPMKLGAAVWLPLMWSGVWEAMRDGSRRGLGMLGLGVALSLLAGYPQITALALLSVALLSLFLLGGMLVAKDADAGSRAKRALALPLGAALGALTAGAQLAPAREMTELSGKMADYPAAVAMSRSLPWKGLGGLVDPFFLGLPGVDRFWGGDAVEFPYAALYVGVIGVVLAAVSWPALRNPPRPRRVRREDLAIPELPKVTSRLVPAFLLAGFVLGLLLALGRFGPLWGVLHAHVPGFAKFRWPATANFLVVAHLAPLAAIGLACLRQDPRRWRPVGTAALALGAAMLLLSILARGPLAGAFRALQLAGSPPFQHAAWDAAHEAWAQSLAMRGEILLVAGALALGLAARSAAGVAWGWTGLVLLDLFLVARAFGTPTAQGFYDRPPEGVQVLRDELGGRRIYTPHSVDQLGNFLAGCRNPVAFEWAKHAMLCNANVAFGVAQAQGCDPLSPRRHDAFAQVFDAPGTPHGTRERIFDLWDAGYLVEMRGVQPLDIPALQDPARGFLLNPHEPALSRATLVSGWESYEDPQALLARLLSPEHDPRQAVLLEAAPGGPAPPAAKAPVGACDLIGYDVAPNRIQAAWHVGRGGMLRILETWAPGWQATVNGQPAPVYRADFLFLAVPVPEGSVQVELTYRPASLPLGAALSAAGILGLFVCFAGGKRRAGAGRHPSEVAWAASSRSASPPSKGSPRPPSSARVSSPTAGSKGTTTASRPDPSRRGTGGTSR